MAQEQSNKQASSLDGWYIERLGTFINIVSGEYFAYNEFVDSGVRVLKIDNIMYGKIDWKNKTFLPESYLDSRKELVLEEGNIVLALNRPITNNEVKVARLIRQDEPSILYQRVGKIQFNHDAAVDNEFLYILFKSPIFRILLSRILMGSDQPYIKTTELLQQEFLLPHNISEQRKIASILSSVDELIQKIEQIIEQTQRLKKGLMQTLLRNGINHRDYYSTEIGNLPNDWKVSTIGNEFKVGTGVTPRRNNPLYFKGNIPWIKTTEIKFNMIKSSKEHITQQALEESSAKLYPKGTILMAMYGEGVTRGKCAILDIDAAINQACAAIQSSDKHDNRFIFYWLQWQYGSIRSKSHGTHQSNLNLEFVRLLKIPCPPYHEQKAIVSILGSVDQLIEKENDSRKKWITLRKELMQQLLTGKIRVEL